MVKLQAGTNVKKRPIIATLKILRTCYASSEHTLSCVQSAPSGPNLLSWLQYSPQYPYDVGCEEM